MNDESADDKRIDELKEVAREILSLSKNYDILNIRVNDKAVPGVSAELTVLFAKTFEGSKRRIFDKYITMDDNRIEGLDLSECEGKYVIFVDIFYNQKRVDRIGCELASIWGEMGGASYISGGERPIKAFPYTAEQIKKLKSYSIADT